MRKHSHYKSNPTHAPFLVKGRLLNRWLKEKKDVDTNHFEPTKDYQICKTLHLTITKANVILFNTTINATPAPSLTPPTTRPLAGTSSSKAAATSTKSYNDAFIETITSTKIEAPQFKQPFHKVNIKTKKERMRYVGKILISACIDKESCREHGIRYLNKNALLASDISNFIDGIKQ